MFTGIIEEVGRVMALERQGDWARLELACTTVLEDASLGDSIAVDGCCLTVSDFTDDGFAADLMAETLHATALGDLEVNGVVNLERAMQAGERLGGHLVQGHVDGVGTVLERVDQPGTTHVRISVPPWLARYLVPKGSITVQGASLTVIDVDGGPAGPSFRVGLIPHTLEATTLGDLAPGDRVNLEVDVIAKYVERLLAAGTDTPYPHEPSPKDQPA